jgi:hypothetical protein
MNKSVESSEEKEAKIDIRVMKNLAAYDPTKILESEDATGKDLNNTSTFTDVFYKT